MRRTGICVFAIVFPNIVKSIATTVKCKDNAPSGIQHVHNYYTETAFNDGRTHIINGTTGPSIPLPNGGHYHYFEGYTTVNGMHPHAHMYNGNTGNEV